ncbi:MAG: TonB-dependent receptor, partial [Bacteroidota bacterium]
MQKLTMICCFFLGPFLYAQTFFSISGTVVDTGNMPVSVGDVLIYDTESDVLDSYTSVLDGKFLFNDVVAGNYRLVVSCLGFEDIKRTFQLDKNLALTIRLKENTTKLEGVEVTASKRAFSFVNGNLKVNVENPIFSAIPDPLGILEKLPGLQVSSDRESVSIIGKGSPLIYMGNQRISIEEFSLLSVDDIVSIEIIKNPSVKYEAEGRSVLLITRKNNQARDLKLKLSETASVKQNFNNYFSINGSYNRNKLTFKGNIAYNQLRAWESNSFEFRIPQRDVLTDYLVLIPVNDRQQINGGAGLFYQINKEDYFSANINLRRQADEFPIETDTFIQDRDVANAIRTETSNENSKDFFSGNLNYNKSLGGGTNLFMGAQYSNFVQKLNTDIFNNTNDSGFARSQMREQRYQINAIAYRLDFEKVFKNGMKWELGGNINEARAGALTEIQNFDLPGITEIDYDYTENTYATYTQLSGNLGKKINYYTGIRIENNQVKGEFEEQGSPVVERNKTNLFPKANIGFQIDSTKNITLTYAESIGRPSFSNTSSITAFINPFLEGSGNINLKPTLTDEVSANFQWKDKSIYIGYSKIRFPIYYTIRFDEGADSAILSPVNIAKESGFDISLTLP